MGLNVTKENVLKLLPAKMDDLREAFGIPVPHRTVSIIDTLLRIKPEPVGKKEQKLEERFHSILKTLFAKGIVQRDQGKIVLKQGEEEVT